MNTTQNTLTNSTEHFGNDLVHIINCIAEPVFIKDQDHRWVQLNDAYCKFMGFRREELIGKTDMDFFPPYQAELFWKMDNEVIQTGLENISEEEFTDASGNVHIIITKKILFTNSDGKKFVVGIINDITERKAWAEKIQKLNFELEIKVQERTFELISTNQKLNKDLIERNKIEKALRLSETRLAALLELNQRRFDSEEALILYALEQAIKLTESRAGYLAFTEQDEKNLHIYAWAGPDLEKCRVDNLQRIFQVDKTGLWGESIRQRRTIITNDYQTENLLKKGQPIGHLNTLRHMSVPIFDGEKIVALIGVANKESSYNESDERQLSLLIDGMWKLLLKRRAEEILATEKELLAVTVGSIGDGVISTDTEAKIVMMNKVAQDLTGWNLDEVKGKQLDTVYQIIDEFKKTKCENPVKDVLETGNKPDIVDNTVLVSRSGKEFNVSFSCAPICEKKGKVIGAVLVFRDITEKRKLEEKLSKTDKLESLGVLAGGIAHDFNNLLTGIFGFVNLARLNIDDNKKQTLQYLQEATKVLGRAQGLARQLLTFSKGGAPLKRIVSLEPLLRNNASFVLSGTDIDCQFDIPEDLWNCDLDENQIGQVIDNIILNARQAMSSGGLLKIRAENIVISETHLPLANGNYVKISIKDNGPGISSDILSRIFDPFFTTKAGGSGLGLATAYSIIKRHDGFIDIISQIGNGANFVVYLPATTKGSDFEKTSEPEISLRKGNILLMDDDEFIRLAASELLKRIGYKVYTAKNGSEAIEKYKSKYGTEEEFIILIMDLTVQGGMGGLQALKILKDIYPNIIAIASSGYSDDPVMASPQKYGFSGALHKPYTLTELISALDKVETL
jgi:PAS domain S-box-containing protein